MVARRSSTKATKRAKLRGVAGRSRIAISIENAVQRRYPSPEGGGREGMEVEISVKNGRLRARRAGRLD